MPGDTLTTHLDAFKQAALSCSIPPAVELIGEKWAFLILRGALNGLKHFEEFQAGLGIARNILSDRLTKLVGGGILERRPAFPTTCASGSRYNPSARSFPNHINSLSKPFPTKASISWSPTASKAGTPTSPSACF
jgi:hypothetical protein